MTLQEFLRTETAKQLDPKLQKFLQELSVSECAVQVEYREPSAPASPTIKS